MSSDFYRDLAWLPAPPADFRARVKALPASVDWEREAKALAGFALGEGELGRLANAIRKAGEVSAPKLLRPWRLGLVGNGTLDLLGPVLVGTFARYGLALEVVGHGYDQFVPAALDPASAINAAGVDAVLVLLDWHGLQLHPVPGNAEAAAASVAGALDVVDAIRDGFRNNAGVSCMLATLAPPPETLAGSFDRLLAGTARDLCERFNAGIAERVRGSSDMLLDVAALAETVGLANWHDPRLWNLAKVPFSPAYAPLWADHVGRVVAAAAGRSRRALVLDLDNTVWGGVIGDDGVEGIAIGQGDATGEAHLEVQRLALALRSRGVVLSVSSKNTDEIARRPFDEHPDMLLKLDHFAVFQANWSDKASNISTIAQELALGLESFVFLDDNPAERALVRANLPEVAVPELPADAALYARALAAGGYFELVTFSAEDSVRAEMYQMNARRAALKSQVADMGSYLASLDMEISFAPFDAVGRARIAQLINKSNQFNLTTRRYTEADVAAFEADRQAVTLQVRLVDRFGDNGMISVVVGKPVGDALEIDTWLMSCRVLGRGVERMVLREILDAARQRGFERVIGRYVPTAKNALVRDHYAGLGFALVEEAGDGSTVWEIAADAEVAAAPMVVQRGNAPASA